MALDGDILGAAIKTAVDGVGDKTDRDAVFKAMGDAIVTYIVANAVVIVTVASVSGVTPGGGASGPGTGTGTVT